MEHNNGAIYCIMDNVADRIAGPLMIYPADAAAIRAFGDIINSKDTIIAQHPADYDLYVLGYITLDNEIIANRRVLLAGKTWLATQEGTTP